MKKFGRFFGQNPKNNAIRLRRAKALRNENTVISSKRRPRLPERGARGENRLRLLSLRQNKDSRRVGGHAPPQRHLKRSAATTKVGANGGENARASVLRSDGVCSPVKKPRTRRRKRGSRGENRISGANSVVFPVLIQTISTSLPFSADSYMPLSIFCMSIACSMG